MAEVHCKFNVKMNNKGQTGGLITALVFGVASLIIAVIIAFVIITTIGDADLLDGGRPTITVTNQSDVSSGVLNVFANTTGYTLSGYNSTWISVTLTEAMNRSANISDGVYNRSIPLANLSLSTVGVLTNGTVIDADAYENISVSYTYMLKSGEELVVDRLDSNFSAGVDNVSDQVPTVLLVAAIVLILSVLAILVGVWQRMRMGGGTTL